ncbi:hypothetical protein DXG01_006730 [Tephrocybe rancida]|nr:hypothetical protein DXG01_006730 [Tephrocybe rancida]
MASSTKDPELASDMLHLMGRELRAARTKIEELESERIKGSRGSLIKEEGTSTSGSLGAENADLKQKNTDLETEVLRLRAQLSDLEDAHKADIQRAEAAEVKLEALTPSSSNVKKPCSDALIADEAQEDPDFYLKQEEDEPTSFPEASVDASGKSASAENQDLKEQVDALFEEKRDVQSQLDTCERARASLKSRLHELAADRAAARQKNTDDLDKIHSLSARVDQQWADLKAERSTTASLKNQLTQVRATAATRKKENECLLRSVQEKSDLTRTCSELRKSLWEVTATNQDLVKTSESHLVMPERRD